MITGSWSKLMCVVMNCRVFPEGDNDDNGVSFAKRVRSHFYLKQRNCSSVVFLNVTPSYETWDYI